MEAKRNESVVGVILNQFTGMLIRGELKPGGEMPAEAEMASRLGVTRTALKDAYKVLNILGVLERRSDGIRISDKVSEMMLNPLILGLIIEQGSKQDLFELRVVMEVGALELAVSKATDDDIQALADNLRKYEGRMVEGDAESLAQLDALFHQQILEMSKNPVFIRLGKSVAQLYALPLAKALNAWGPEQILQNHRAVYEAIVARDRDRARQLMTNAFQRTKEFF